jgi:hypothetical protein
MRHAQENLIEKSKEETLVARTRIDNRIMHENASHKYSVRMWIRFKWSRIGWSMRQYVESTATKLSEKGHS